MNELSNIRERVPWIVNPKSHHIHLRFQWVMSCMSRSHVTHVNTSYNICEWVPWLVNPKSYHTHLISHIFSHGGDQTKNIWISKSLQKSVFFWKWRGLRFLPRKRKWESWGLPRKRVWYVRELPWKPVRIFGSRDWFKSDFVRSWYWDFNESCHACQWVISHIWMSQLTCVNESPDS